MNNSVLALGSQMRRGLRRPFFGRDAAFAFDPVNLRSQPLLQSLFHFELAAGSIQIFNGFLVRRELDKPARNALFFLPIQHKLLQQAALARLGVGGIAEIRARRRILKNRRRPPWRMRGSTIPTVEQEAQFKSKYIQNVASILSHRAPLLRVRMPEGWVRHRKLGHQEL